MYWTHMLLRLMVDSEYESIIYSVRNWNINECDFSKISCVETESELNKPANPEFAKLRETGKVRRQMIITNISLQKIVYL